MLVMQSGLAERLQAMDPCGLYTTLRVVDRDFCRCLPDFDVHYVYLLKVFNKLWRNSLFGAAWEARRLVSCLRVLLHWMEISGSRARILRMCASVVDDCVIQFWNDNSLSLEASLLLQELSFKLPEVARQVGLWHTLARSYARVHVSSPTACYQDYERRSHSWESAGADGGVIPIEVFLCDYALRRQDLAWADRKRKYKRDQQPLADG